MKLLVIKGRAERDILAHQEEINLCRGKMEDFLCKKGFGLKFIYSEKATKFCEIFTLLLSVCTVDKSKVKISQNFVAFSEYMNFNVFCIFLLYSFLARFFNVFYHCLSPTDIINF